MGGSLARALAMEVASGQGPDPGPGHGCAGFVLERDVWSGRLADFPTAGAPAVDPAPILPGRRRVFRFRVALGRGVPTTSGESATQDIAWKADLKPRPVNPGGGRSRDVAGIPGNAAAPRRCAVVTPSPRPRRIMVGTTPAHVAVGPGGVVTARRPFRARVSVRSGGLSRVGFRLGDSTVLRSRRVDANGTTTWTAELTPARLGSGRRTLAITLDPARGRPHVALAHLAVQRCTAVLAASVAPGGAELSLRIDSTAEVRGLSVTLPVALRRLRGRLVVVRALAGGGSARQDTSARARSGVRLRGPRVEVSGLPAGTGIVALRLAVFPGARDAAMLAACRRARIQARLATSNGLRAASAPLRIRATERRR